MAQAEMRAAVVEGPGAIGLGTLPRSEPAPGEIRVRVSACGICGSDVHLHRAGLFHRGATPGHEFAGTVERLGDGVTHLSPGDAVAVEPFRTCGRCEPCRQGRYSICRQARLIGVQDPGGLAEYALVPARRAFRVPADLNPRLAALTEPVAVVIHGLRRGGFEPGQRVLVLGAGSLGLLAVAVARRFGAGDVWVTARHAHQGQRALQLGASRVIEEARADPERLDALGREVPVDLAVETVGGEADTLRAAAAALRPGGAVAVLGVFLGPVSLDPLSLLLKEVTLAWSYCYAHGEERADFEDAIAFIDAEREQLAGLLTHEVPLEEVSDAFRIAGERGGGAVKVSVLP
jgi:2-desacetyl-2-hydroxyethyl bacteriochlorophyllide A dehydrogenase